ncbi:UNVERIFIED_CONTAM: hypothetical protein K2H54_026694 [Gekko kuhli]
MSKVIVRAELEKLKNALKENNLQDLSKQINEELKSLNSATLDIAITGMTGTGKSSLVNALRGMGDFDQGSAKTGNIETTKKPEKYTHPVFPNVTVWDLPGIGSPDFKADKYLQKTNFAKYDFFIIVASERFTENDVLLTKEIRKMNKKYYFVRSKVDQSIKAEERNPDFHEEESLEKMKGYCCEDKGMQPFMLQLIGSSSSSEAPAHQKLQLNRSSSSSEAPAHQKLQLIGSSSSTEAPAQQKLQLIGSSSSTEAPAHRKLQLIGSSSSTEAPAQQKLQLEAPAHRKLQLIRSSGSTEAPAHRKLQLNRSSSSTEAPAHQKLQLNRSSSSTEAPASEIC